jgi:hypothetical protein
VTVPILAWHALPDTSYKWNIMDGFHFFVYCCVVLVLQVFRHFEVKVGFKPNKLGFIPNFYRLHKDVLVEIVCGTLKIREIIFL